VKRAVFLDRDGTLIEERNYISRPEQVAVFNGAGAALKRLQDAGFLLFVVTNQSGVGRGLLTMNDVDQVNARVAEEYAKDGVQLLKFYVAPEGPHQPSRGRKPSPQFLFDAEQEFGLDLRESYVIGDKPSDLECGWNAGVKMSLMVRTGYGAEHERRGAAKKTNALIVDDLAAAAEWILSFGG
jgi:D-glycero-D-manno-heptose 1,7-bisphosphate phosphatase